METPVFDLAARAGTSLGVACSLISCLFFLGDFEAGRGETDLAGAGDCEFPGEVGASVNLVSVTDFDALTELPLPPRINE